MLLNRVIRLQSIFIKSKLETAQSINNVNLFFTAAEAGLRTVDPVIAVLAPATVAAGVAAGTVILDQSLENVDETENGAEAAIARGAGAVTARGAEATSDDADQDPGTVNIGRKFS